MWFRKEECGNAAARPGRWELEGSAEKGKQGQKLPVTQEGSWEQSRLWKCGIPAAMGLRIKVGEGMSLRNKVRHLYFLKGKGKMGEAVHNRKQAALKSNSHNYLTPPRGAN